MPVRTKRHVYVKIKVSGVATPVTLVTDMPTDMDVSIDQFGPGFQEAIAVMNNGEFYERVVGDDEPITGSVSVKEDTKIHDSAGSEDALYDLLNLQNKFSAGSTADPGTVVTTWDYIEIGTIRKGVSSGLRFPNVYARVGYQAQKEFNLWTINWESRWTSSDPVVEV